MRSLSIRTRLTLWYFCFFAAAGLLLGIASWFLLQGSLDSLLLHELDERTDDVESFLDSHGPDASLETLRTELMREYQVKDEGKWLQILDRSGNWLYYSSRGRIANPIPPLPSSPGKQLPFVPVSPHSLRTYSRDIHAGGHTYRVYMAISADSSALILSRFGRDIWLLVPIVLVIAGIVGHFLSRKALNPIVSIIKDVRRINDRNLSTRLPTFDTHDELALLSETLNQMLERIDTAFRSVRTLTANSSHELRTPLSLIRTRVEIALCFPRSADQYRTVLEEVQADTVRTTALIENLLALARYDAGIAEPELRPVEITSLVSKAAQEWALTAERLSLQLQITETVKPVWVLGDVGALERAMRMLIDNACRYTQPGGWIRLGVNENADVVCISVSDSGIGIADHEQARIFERFYRAQQSQESRQAGSGLGLSLAKWIVEQHQGSITVTSKVGAGSSFRISLPTYVAAIDA